MSHGCDRTEEIEWIASCNPQGEKFISWLRALGAIGLHQIPRWITRHATPGISPIPDRALSNVVHLDLVHVLGAIGPCKIPWWMACQATLVFHQFSITRYPSCICSGICPSSVGHGACNNFSSERPEPSFLPCGLLSLPSLDWLRRSASKNPTASLLSPLSTLPLPEPFFHWRTLLSKNWNRRANAVLPPM